MGGEREKERINYKTIFLKENNNIVCIRKRGKQRQLKELGEKKEGLTACCAVVIVVDNIKVDR